MSAPPSLPVNAALLLDIDGTLLDIAPTPSMVVVPPGLPDSLATLMRHLSDAVALVTGRPIEQVDALFGDLVTAVAGEHGGAIRHRPDAAVARATAHAMPPGWLAHAEALAAATDGVLLEHKAHGFVLHYRLAPEAGPALYREMQALLEDTDGESHLDRFTVMAARMAWEMKPAGIDKGVAVAAVMAGGPFVGRVPVYIGDDTTDEDGIRAAIALGGIGLRVPDVFGDAAGVRAWLASEAARLEMSQPAGLR